MFWLRVFWVEAAVLPAIIVGALVLRPADMRYRTLNLLLWSAALVAALAGLAYSRRRRAREGEGHGSSAH
jgi:hypothetical protein